MENVAELPYSPRTKSVVPIFILVAFLYLLSFVIVVGAVETDVFRTLFGGSRVSPPTNIMAENGILQWNEVADADGYRVNVFSSGGTSGNGGTVVNNSFMIMDGLIEGATYGITIQSTQGSKISVESHVLDYVHTDPSGANAQTLETPHLGSTSDLNFLSWQAVPNAMLYDIYCNNEKIAQTKSLSFDISNFKDKQYTYKVKALSSTPNYRHSSFSDEIMI